MSFSNSAIVERFANGVKKGRSGNIFIEDDTLYSYSHDFPLAVRLPNGHFVVNADKRSSTTSGHQSIVLRILPQKKTTAIADSAFPFQVMRSLVDGSAKLLDFTEDQYESGIVGEDTPPQNNEGWDVSLFRDQIGKQDKWRAHKPGGALIKLNKARWEDEKKYIRKYFLCGVDEGSYFCCQLAKSAKTMLEAFEHLQPHQVRLARQENKDVVRQGEWFFIPQDIATRHLPRPSLGISLEEAMLKVNPKDKYPIGTNYHEPREVRLNGSIYCRGRVVHRNTLTGKATGEHGSVLLGEIWHEVHRNTAVQSWSASGRFD